MSGALHFQRKNSSSLNASSLKLTLPDVSLGDLQVQRPQHFTVHLDHIEPHESIEEFHGVIGQDGELVHKDDYVELTSCHYQVRYDHTANRIQYYCTIYCHVFNSSFLNCR